MPFATTSISDCFNLALSAATAEGPTTLQAFGRYWVWARSDAPGDAPLRLFEETPKGIAEITTQHASVHVVKANAPFHIEGLIGYWLTADADTHWLQIPTSDPSLRRPDRRRHDWPESAPSAALALSGLRLLAQRSDQAVPPGHSRIVSRSAGFSRGRLQQR